MRSESQLPSSTRRRGDLFEQPAALRARPGRSGGTSPSRARRVPSVPRVIPRHAMPRLGKSRDRVRTICPSQPHEGREAMNIVVCVKYVPDATADRKFKEDNTVDRVGVDGLLSELDEYAVEQALQFREKREGEEIAVTALTVGPEKAVDAVRKALQMGVDKGVHVLDEAIAGSDYIATSLVLAKAIEKIGPADLV